MGFTRSQSLFIRSTIPLNIAHIREGQSDARECAFSIVWQTGFREKITTRIQEFLGLLSVRNISILGPWRREHTAQGGQGTGTGTGTGSYLVVSPGKLAVRK